MLPGSELAARVDVDRLRFWLLLVPTLFIYLITEPDNIKLIYLVAPAWIAIDLLRKRFAYRMEDRRVLFALLIYALITALSVISAMTQLNQRALFRDVFIIASPLLIFLNPAETIRRPGTALFVVFTVAYFASFIRSSGTLSFSDFNPLNLILPSETRGENNFGVVFGLFALHFLMNRKWAWFCLALLISIMVSKRAVIIGLALAGSFWPLLNLLRARDGVALKMGMLALFVSLGLGAVFLVEIGAYALEISGMGDLRLDRFLMGRDGLLLTLRDNAFGFSLSSFFGHGPGTSDTFLAFSGSGWGPLSERPFNPHNDHMKLLYDYGYIGYLLFFFFLYNFYGPDRKGLTLMAYTITVFCFDNSLIFVVYAIVAGFLTSEYRKPVRPALTRGNLP